MLGHRTLNVEDYLTILKRRWWIIAIPAIILPIIAYGVTFFIQPQFISQTLVLIEQQRVPSDIVKSLDMGDLDSRLASMREQILSRSSLQPIIEKYHLYEGQKMSMDARIDLTRASIDIKPIHSEIARSNGLPGFFISFTANDAKTAQLVCGEIQSLFVKQSVISTAATADETTEFLRSQLDQAKHTLDDQDTKLAQFKQQNFGKLPTDEGNNVSILSSLGSHLDATTASIQQYEQNRSVLEAMIASQQAQPVTSSGAPVVQNTLAQQSELDALEAHLAELRTHYTDDYPDVKSDVRKIEELRRQIQKAAAPAPAAPAPTVKRADSLSMQQLNAQLKGLDLAIQNKKKEQDQIEQQIRSYQGRVESTPQVEAQYTELTRDSTVAQANYQTILAKLGQSKMATDLQHRQEGETFRVLDEPNLPDGPFFPKKNVFVSGGLALGLGIGLLITAMLEYKDTALRSERDIWAFTQLPTLAVVAWSGDIADNKPRRWARLKRPFSRRKNQDLLPNVSA